MITKPYDLAENIGAISPIITGLLRAPRSGSAPIYSRVDDGFNIELPELVFAYRPKVGRFEKVASLGFKTEALNPQYQGFVITQYLMPTPLEKNMLRAERLELRELVNSEFPIYSELAIPFISRATLTQVRTLKRHDIVTAQRLMDHASTLLSRTAEELRLDHVYSHFASGSKGDPYKISKERIEPTIIDEH